MKLGVELKSFGRKDKPLLGSLQTVLTILTFVIYLTELEIGLECKRMFFRGQIQFLDCLLIFIHRLIN